MSSRPKPLRPASGAALPRAADGAEAPVSEPPLLVEDHLEPRVRLPADLIRSVIALAEIAVLVGLALLAGATASGVEVDVVRASSRLPVALLHLLGFAGGIALLILPIALAIRLLVVRQYRRLSEAVLTGGVATGAVALMNLLLNQPFMLHLHNALHTTTFGVTGRHEATLDGYLAGLVAYVTVIGLRGRGQWRSLFLTAIGFYALATLTNPQTHTTVLSLLITIAIGMLVGSGLRYALGTTSGRPTAQTIAAALSDEQNPIVAIRRMADGAPEVRRYSASRRDGDRLDITVFDREQQAADAFYRLYRRVRLRANVSRSAPLSLEGAIERQALLIYATEDSGVLTPRLRSVLRVGPDAAVIATDHLDGRKLGALGAAVTDQQLREIWDTVLQLHKHRITHRALTEDRIMFTGPDLRKVALLEPGNGDVAATELQVRLDLTQLIAQTALLVGPDRAADIAIEKVPAGGLLALVPLLQPVALFRSTRSALRGNKKVITELRKRLMAAAPDGEVMPVQVERVRPRTLITLLAGVFAAYVLAGQLANVSFSRLLSQANLPWSLVALAFSACTYIGAAMALSGFVLERLNALRTLLVQVASSFVILVTPVAVGHVALNVRYLRKAKLSAADAAASVGVSQVMSFAVFAVLVVISAAVAGSSKAAQALTPPHWAYLALGILVGLTLIVLALPAGRRQLLRRVRPIASQVIPRLLDVAQRPAKLAQGIGGTVLISVAYILCLAASVRAVGDSHVPLASIAVVFLAGNAAGSFIPTPGGIGAVETALSLALAGAGMQAAQAITAVLLFRTVTFWLPVLAGWVSLHYLQRRDVV